MIDSKQVCILFLGDSSHPMKKTYPTTPRERPSTAPPTAAPQAPRARPVGVRSAGTQIFANKKKHPRKVAMWEKKSMVQYLPTWKLWMSFSILVLHKRAKVPIKTGVIWEACERYPSTKQG